MYHATTIAGQLAETVAGGAYLPFPSFHIRSWLYQTLRRSPRLPCSHSAIAVLQAVLAALLDRVNVYRWGRGARDAELEHHKNEAAGLGPGAPHGQHARARLQLHAQVHKMAVHAALARSLRVVPGLPLLSPH